MRLTIVIGVLLSIAAPTAAQDVEVLIGAEGAGPGKTLDAPTAIGHGADGSRWVAGDGSRNLFRIDEAGAIDEVLATWPDLDAAAGIVVAPDGTLFVSSHFGDAVLRVGADGSHEIVLSKFGAGVGQGLDAPVELALDAGGNLYAAGRESSNVLRLDPGGTVTQLIGPAGAGAGKTLNNARDVAVDALGTVYVAGLFSDNVLAVTPPGPVVQLIGPAGDGAGHPCDGPAAFAIGPDGSLYVAARFGHSVLKRTPAGVVSAVIDASGDGLGHALTFPADLAFAPDGTLYVAGWGSDNVFAIAPGGAITRVADVSGDGEGHTLDDPSDLVVDGDGTVFVACAMSNQVFRIDGDGVTHVGAVAGYGSSAEGVGDGALALDTQDRLLVGGWENDEVVRFEQGGETTLVVDDSGGPNGFFNGADAIAVDSQGRAYIGGDSLVFRIEPTGEYEMVLDGSGDGLGHHMSGVDDLLFDSAGRLFVAGALSNNVLRLDPDGSITQVVGPEGAGPGQALAQPREMAFGDDGTLYITSVTRLFALDTQGVVTQVVDKWDLNPSAPQTGSLGTLMGVDVDALGRLIVSTYEFAADVHRVNPDGTIEPVWWDPDLVSAAEIAVDDGGAVYVATEYNNDDAVLRVEPSGATSVVLTPAGDGAGHLFGGPQDLVVTGPGRFDVVGETFDAVFSVDLGFCGGFTLLPAALPGDGSGPLLTGEGSLCGGDPVLIRITRGRPSVVASLVVGLTPLGLPFKGGTMVPLPSLIVPVVLNAQGAASLSVGWPTLPSGVSLWLQAWMPDPSGPLNFKATNGLRIAIE